MKRTLAVMGALAIGGLVGVGCYGGEYAATPTYAARPVTIAVAPPPPVDEVPPRTPPYAGAVWMSGYWDWRADLGRHVWVAGHWGMPPRTGVAYMPPSWHSAPSGGYYRVPGRWVAAATTDAYGRHIAYDTLGRPHYF